MKTIQLILSIAQSLVELRNMIAANMTEIKALRVDIAAWRTDDREQVKTWADQRFQRKRGAP